MRIRHVLAGVLVILVLIGCAPDDDAQGGGSPSTHPSGHETPASDSAPGGRYDY